ncbi:unnamed protein product [Ceratitis capitata]|uniref:(Mediterranean fruit fly) hypothetical protein n=1 Tax=Ceratitis capitata TaxID=7213 RepID=A0A811V332_CERCA|nr:unnamed protein product [Ceratitis capitata]
MYQLAAAAFSSPHTILYEYGIVLTTIIVIAAPGFLHSSQWLVFVFFPFFFVCAAYVDCYRIEADPLRCHNSVGTTATASTDSFRGATTSAFVSLCTNGALTFRGKCSFFLQQWPMLLLLLPQLP